MVLIKAKARSVFASCLVIVKRSFASFVFELDFRFAPLGVPHPSCIDCYPFTSFFPFLTNPVLNNLSFFLPFNDLLPD